MALIEPRGHFRPLPGNPGREPVAVDVGRDAALFDLLELADNIEVRLKRTPASRDGGPENEPVPHLLFPQFARPDTSLLYPSTAFP